MAEQFIESTLMDGYVGGPHITETQTGLANQGLYGPDDYVLSAGRKAEAQILTNNSIRIFDAVFVIQGRRDVIAANDYTDVSIDNGAQGMNRNDIIVRRYTKDESSEIEKTEYAVIKGTPTSGEAEDPAVTIGDIRSGALEHEMKLYRVKLEGLNIVAVEPLFQVLMDMSTLNAYLTELRESAHKAISIYNNGNSGISHASSYGMTPIKFPNLTIDNAGDYIEKSSDHSALVMKKDATVLIIGEVELASVSSGIYSAITVNGNYTSSAIYGLVASGIGSHSRESVTIRSLKAGDKIQFAIGKASAFSTSAANTHARLSAYVL